METITTCPECGTVWENGLTCQDHFHQMLFWESENPALGVVHHYLVLCYHLQHPSLYSPDGLRAGHELLVSFLNGATTQEMGKQNKDRVDSGKRSWKVTARPDSSGSYEHPIEWTMRAGDVVAGGTEQYIDNVKIWAQSIYDSLRASYNLLTDAS